MTTKEDNLIKIIAQWNYGSDVRYQEVVADSVEDALNKIYSHPSFNVPADEMQRMTTELLATTNKRVEGHSWYWLVRVPANDKRTGVQVFQSMNSLRLVNQLI